MFYKNLLVLIIFLFMSNCTTKILDKNIQSENIDPKNLIDGFSNKGFALIYSDDLYKKNIISKKISERSMIIFQKNLNPKTQVKITNILNSKSVIGTVGKNSKYPLFNNSVISIRIAEELDIDINQPYVEILEILENSIFIAKKAKTYDEEREVAIKAPINSISINDLSLVKTTSKKDLVTIFNYTIKIADFYFKDTALIMVNRIKKNNLIENLKVRKITTNKYRVYSGPFNNISSLQKSYNDISILKFENIEIIRND